MVPLTTFPFVQQHLTGQRPLSPSWAVVPNAAGCSHPPLHPAYWTAALCSVSQSHSAIFGRLLQSCPGNKPRISIFFFFNVLSSLRLATCIYKIQILILKTEPRKPQGCRPSLDISVLHDGIITHK